MKNFDGISPVPSYYGCVACSWMGPTRVHKYCSDCHSLRQLRPEIVVLCGSTRFIGRMAVEAWELEKKGIIALSCHLLPAWYAESKVQAHHQAEAEGVAEILDELHLRKIDLADRVAVINVDGYIGESTRAEIQYAIDTGKPVDYLEVP